MRYPVIFLLVLVCAWYLSFLATRLDRLHHRVETSWATLDGLLQQRAAIALEIAHSEISDPAISMLLTQTAHQAREADIRGRTEAESALSGTLGLLMSHGAEVDGNHPLLTELFLITEKIRVAIAIHIEAVQRTQLLRGKFLVKIFRLAGHAPLPVTYEFEADVI